MHAAAAGQQSSVASEGRRADRRARVCKQVSECKQSERDMWMPYLDEAYRAARTGAQVGAAAVLLLWVTRLFGICSCLGALLCPCGVFAVAAVAGVAAALHVNNWRLPTGGRGVLVTGCDSGFGLAAALHLQALGCIVFAGCLQTNPGKESDGVKRLRLLKGVHVIPLDVTDEKQVEEARKYVEKHMPIKGLWGVVNNAGVFSSCPSEWTSPEEASRVYDINSLGPLRVAKTFLPLLRQTRGRLVNMSSVSGRSPCPLFASYSMSKHALEALSDCLRWEQRRFGVDVCIVEPGNFAAATSILQPSSIRATFSSSWEKLGVDAKASYGDGYAEKAVDDMLRSQASPTAHSQDISPVLVSIESALFARHPAPRYHPSDLPFLVRTWLATHGPEWLYERLYT